MRIRSWFADSGVNCAAVSAHELLIYCARMEVARVACVGAIVRDHEGRLLLVRRGTEPGRGLWSVPGGRVEPGETAEAATAREVHEETGLHIQVESRAGVVERDGLGGVLYVIEDFHARPGPGADPRDVRAGDDADDVGWFTPDELVRLECVTGLLDALGEWGVLP